MFAAPENKTIPQIESDAIAFWKKEKIFEKSVESKDKNNAFVFYDGPPFISGLPHYGHLLSSIAKDIVPRYWAMKGKRVERVWGWDAHGLTVENKVQKKLTIKNRRDIESFGLEKFTQACYTYTSEISAEWGWYIDHIGRWVDFENAYKTIDQTYMESVMWVFKQLYEKGLIYEGVRTSLYCTTCGTPVSNFEVAMDNTYKEVEDPSLTVGFKVTTPGKFAGTYLLAWTTTPWTLPSNRALVVDKNEQYVLVESNKQKYVCAEKRCSHVFANVQYMILETLSGKELLDLEYEAPYAFFAKTAPDFKVYHYDGMVNMEEGTGIVHSAPGFGEVDTTMGSHFGLRIMLTINDEGKFIPGDSGENPFGGMYFSKANPYIINDLAERGIVFKNETLMHRFPYHDRCNTLLVQKAQNSWFINVASLKDRLLKNNEGINWIPDHLKEGRFAKGIEQAPDWCISRSRFWATPMPVWRNEEGDTIVVGSISELEELSGTKITDLHRPYIDEVVITKNGSTYKRIPEVLDSWFEAGSMPYGQWHYPFENKAKFDANFPGDYIVEYIPQTRAWFYVMHVISTALFDKNSFKNAIGHGTLAGNDGRKMSKTYGNYADPKEVLENIGGDALRIYLMSSPLMSGDNANFDEVELKNKSRNVLNPLYNSLKFFLLYAHAHKWKPVGSDMPTTSNDLDKWIITRLHETIKAFAVNIEKYYLSAAVSPIELFVDDLSRWYVRRTRDRISEGDESALGTLYYVLLTISKAVAPIIPFMAEEIYRALSVDCESVHLETYPGFSEKIIKDNAAILAKVATTREIVSKALAIRSAHSLSVRMPLATLCTISPQSDFYADQISEEVNVKNIKAYADLTSKEYKNYVHFEDAALALDIALTDELKLEGESREMIRKFQSLRKEHKLSIADSIEAFYPDTPENEKLIAVYGKDIQLKIQATRLTPGTEFEIKKLDA